MKGSVRSNWPIRQIGQMSQLAARVVRGLCESEGSNLLRA